MSEYARRVAERVDARRRLARVQLKTLAAAIGVTPDSASRKMQGKQPLSLDDLEAIAPELGTTPAVLADPDAPLDE